MLGEFSGTVKMTKCHLAKYRCLILNSLKMTLILRIRFVLSSVSSLAGFPDHPLRGFETVQYMLEVILQTPKSFV